jgi:hypothetical protein
MWMRVRHPALACGEVIGEQPAAAFREELAFGSLQCTAKRAVMGKKNLAIAYDIYQNELGR